LGFSSVLQADSGIIPQIKPQPLISMSSPIYYSAIMPSFDAVKSELLTALLNKLEIIKSSESVIKTE
jgi:hypothetical protein